MGQKCFRAIVQQAVAQLDQEGAFAESATTHETGCFVIVQDPLAKLDTRVLSKSC